MSTELPSDEPEKPASMEPNQAIRAEVASLLTANEVIEVIAVQGVTAVAIRKDAVVVTNNRVIFYRPSLLGVKLADILWQDVADARFTQSLLGAEIEVKATDGRSERIERLEKEPAKRAYVLCQQHEQEWREKRRVREMEEARAKAGGIVIGQPVASSQASDAVGKEDPLEKLKKAKAMMDAGLISEAEYETIKAKVLSEF